jgi:hypothetical protein
LVETIGQANLCWNSKLGREYTWSCWRSNFFPARDWILHVPRPIKGPWKGLLPSVALFGGSGTFRRWGLIEGPQVIGGMPPKWILGPLPLSLLLLIPGHEVSSLLCHTLPVIVTQHTHERPKAMDLPGLGLEPSKLWARTTPFYLLSQLSWVFHYSDRKLTSILLMKKDHQE